MSKLEQQLRDIFGPNYEEVRDQKFADLDARLAADLITAIGFDAKPVAAPIQALFDSLELTHAQQACVITELMARQSEKCVIASVVNVKTLEANLAASLVKSAREAGADYKPLLDSAFDEIEDIAGMAAA